MTTQVEIAVEYCGLCHSDLSMIDNEWGFRHYPLFPAMKPSAKSPRSARCQKPQGRPDRRPRLEFRQLPALRQCLRRGPQPVPRRRNDHRPPTWRIRHQGPRPLGLGHSHSRRASTSESRPAPLRRHHGLQPDRAISASSPPTASASSASAASATWRCSSPTSGAAKSRPSPLPR